MDCFTAVAGGDSTSGLLIIPQQQAGSFGARGSLYLPRLCSIPEVAEPLAAAAQRLRASESGAQSGDMAACAAAAAAQRRRLSGCGDKQRRRHAHSSPGSGTQFALDSDSSGHSSSGSSSCTSSACSDKSDGDATDTHTPAAQEPAVVELAPDHPAPVLANTWSYNIRHFTDCVPVTASLAVHHSSGDACAQNRPASSCSSSRPGEQQRGVQLGSSGEAPPLLEELALHDLDASEWQPWDRVARWLDGHNTAAAAAAAAAASPAAASDMAALLVPAVRHQAAAEQPAVAAAPAGPVSSSSTSSRSRHKQQQQGADEQQPEQQQQESGEFDAPDWWQASVVARLEEQREAFHGSWWSRFKVMTGLAA